MRIPETSCQWINRAAKELGSCTFQMFVNKMEDIQEEFGGSPRKQTKVETIVEGFKAAHNVSAAQNLIGAKFVISRSGKPLALTVLPADVLENFTLPKEYEDSLSGAGTAKTPVSSGAFAGFGRPNVNSPLASSGDNQSKRIALGAKRMFIELGAALEVVYAHEDNDLVIVQVTKNNNPESIIDAVFEGGEHPAQQDNWRISFGLLKDIK